MKLLQRLSDFARWPVKLAQALAGWVVRTKPVKYLILKGWITPNGLTTSRLVIAGGQLAIFWIGYRLTGSMAFLQRVRRDIFTLFLVGGATDLFDGAIAREYSALFSEEVKKFGRNFDRHVDKVFTTVHLCYSIFYGATAQTLVAVMILGDIGATVLAVKVARLQEAVSANNLGKIKMVAQCFSVGWMIWGFGELGLLLLLGISLASGAASLWMNFTLKRAELKGQMMFRWPRRRVETQGASQ